MHSTAMGPPPARMEPQTFGAYAPGTSLPSGSTPAAPYSQGYTQHAWSMGAPAHGGLFDVPDWDCWDGGSVSLSELEGGGAGPDIIGPSRRMMLHLHSLRMTRSRRRLLRLVLTVLQMHSRSRRGTYADVLELGGRTKRARGPGQAE
jgi:hypothetical protein